jgi:hypothetical protein
VNKPPKAITPYPQVKTTQSKFFKGRRVIALSSRDSLRQSDPNRKRYSSQRKPGRERLRFSHQGKIGNIPNNDRAAEIAHCTVIATDVLRHYSRSGYQNHPEVVVEKRDLARGSRPSAR